MAGLERIENSGPAAVPVDTDHQPGQSQLMQQIATCGSASIFVSFYAIVTPLLADLCVTIFIIASLVSVILPYSPAHLTKALIFAGLYCLLLYQVLAKMTLPALKRVFLDLLTFSWAAPVLSLTPEGIHYRGRWQIRWREIKSIRTQTTVSWDSDSYQDYMLLEVTEEIFSRFAQYDRDDLQNSRQYPVDGACPKPLSSHPYIAVRIDSFKSAPEEIKKCADHLWRQAWEMPGQSDSHFI